MRTMLACFGMLALSLSALAQGPRFAVRRSAAPPNVVPLWCTDTNSLTLYRPDMSVASTTPLTGPAIILTVDRFGYLWMAGPTGVYDTLYQVDLLAPAPAIANSVVMLGSTLLYAAVSPDDKLWVVDTASRQLLHFDSGAILRGGVPIVTDQPTIANLAIAPTQDATTWGYFVWIATYNDPGAQARVLRIDPSGTHPDVGLFKSNARVLDVAIGPGGDVWIPIEVGGSTSTDRIDRHSADGSFLCSASSSGWTGTFSFSAVAAAGGRIWVGATDGHGNGSVNPKVVFEYDGCSFVQGWNLAPPSLPSGMTALCLDGLGNVWAGVHSTCEIVHIDAGTGMMTTIPACCGPQMRTTGTGYVLANVIYPGRDFDEDGVPNRAELLAGTNPFE